LAFHDDGSRPQLIETIFVPRGAEERAVRSGLARARSSIVVVPTGIGPLAAARAAEEALAAATFGTALCTGVCGLLSPAFVAGDTLVYRELVAEDNAPLELEPALGAAVAARLPGSQSGIRALGSGHILTSVQQKRAAVARYGAQAVDMESYALVERLQRAGVAVAVARVGSDAAADDLPELDRALNGSGGIDGFALALAMLRAPQRGLRLALGASRALFALERVVARVAAAA
jgi:nucleoside phosphorylase